ncbi:hypothetical protein GCM10009837_42460 [Streptomyces durmitorensis]
MRGGTSIPTSPPCKTRRSAWSPTSACPAKDNRAPFGEGRTSEGRARFRSLLHSEAAQADLGELAEHAGQARVAVLCFERDQQRCHRHVVLETLRKRTSLPVSPLA